MQLESIVRQLYKLGEQLAGLVSVSGVSLQIRGLQLTISDPEPLKREARRHAMNDARNKATQLAESAGGNLGRIVSIDEGSSPTGIPYWGFATRAAATIPQVQVEPGSLTVTCRVAVAYELSV